MNYKWPLNVNNFTWLDRLRICAFFLNPSNRWTQDKFVRKYEEEMANYVGCRFAVFVSSGSAANQLIAQKIKDDLIKKRQWHNKNKVVLNVVSWATNSSVWIREGFEPIYVDANLEDFSLDYIKLEEILKARHKEIACVFPTSVLGFVPDMGTLLHLQEKYNIKIYMDNCENTMGDFNHQNVCSYFTSTTSCFFAHQITTGSEGGFIFTNSEEEYEYFLLARAHGLLRNFFSYEDKLSFDPMVDHNKLVDIQFDFQVLSSNYRSSDINAMMGLLDLNRIHNSKNKRIELYHVFERNLSKDIFKLPSCRFLQMDVPFCLPIVLYPSIKPDYKLIPKIKEILKEEGIESRSFISGNMLRQKAYKKFGNYKEFPVAEHLHKGAIYIGLHNKVTESNIEKLMKDLKKL